MTAVSIGSDQAHPIILTEITNYPFISGITPCTDTLALWGFHRGRQKLRAGSSRPGRRVKRYLVLGPGAPASCVRVDPPGGTRSPRPRFRAVDVVTVPGSSSSVAAGRRGAAPRAVNMADDVAPPRCHRHVPALAVTRGRTRPRRVPPMHFHMSIQPGSLGLIVAQHLCSQRTGIITA